MSSRIAFCNRLEPRLLFADVSWTGGGGYAYWDDPNNWSLGHVPTEEDTVTINVTGNPTIVIDGYADAYRVINAGTLVIRASAGAPTASLYVADRLTNNGIVRLEGEYAPQLNLSQFVNQGTLDIPAEPTHIGAVFGAFINAANGVVQVGDGARLIVGANDGTVRFDAGSTVNIGSSAQMNVSGALFDHAGGTVNGQLYLDGCRISLHPSTPASTYHLKSKNALITDVPAGAELCVEATGPLETWLTLQPNLVNSGTIRLTSQPFAIRGSRLTCNGSFTNNGLIVSEPGPAPGTWRVMTFTGKLDGGGNCLLGGALYARFAGVRQSSLSVRDDALVEIDAAGTDATTSVVGALAIGSTARLNLANNALVIDYPSTSPSPLASVRAAAFNGRAGGAWNGAGGFNSPFAAQVDHAIGYAEASFALGAPGGTFAGVAVDATAILVRATRLGDANLDKTVAFEDLLTLAQHYGTAAANWSDGDFNDDGIVNFDDLLLLARNFGQGVISNTNIMAERSRGSETGTSGVKRGRSGSVATLDSDA